MNSLQFLINTVLNVNFYQKIYIKIKLLMNVQYNTTSTSNHSPLKISKNFRKSESTAHSSQSFTIKAEDCFSNLDRKIDVISESDDYVHLQKQIPLKTKIKLIDWIISICWNYRINNQSLYLCVYLLQLYLKKKSIEKKMLQGLALACLFISNKYYGGSKLKLCDLLQMCKNIYISDQILKLQQQILEMVGYDLQVPSINKYYQSYLWSLTEQINNDQRIKIQFWLQIILLKGSGQSKKTSKIFLEILNMVTQQNEKHPSYESLELIHFAQKLEYKTIIHKFMSKFDVQTYLNQFS